MRHPSLLLLSLAVLVLLLQLVEARHVLFERTRSPHEWQPLRRAAPSSPVSFTIGLRGATVDDMAATFWSITDPTSDRYLQLLSRDEIEQRFGASTQHRQLVQQWLSSGGVSNSEIQHVSSSIAVTTRADVAERLFSTEMRLFQHATSGKQVVRAWGKAELPDDVHVAVELVTGLSSFPIPRRSPIKPAIALATREAVIPQTLREIYQIRDQTPGSSEATQGVIEFEGEYFSNDDTLAFATAVGYTSDNTSILPISSSHIVGDNNPSFPGVESTLDVQMISGTNLEAQTWFWIESGNSWLYEYAQHALNTSVVPQVVSISYGFWEGMQCWADAPECELLDITSDQYTAATNALFMKMGMQGTSILVSSGDSGANSRTDELCQAYNLRPEYPASSPYVTTVGATMIINATYGFTDVPACQKGQYSCIVSGYEVAVSRSRAGFTSGGGFSNTTGATRPSYQDAVVQAYLDSGVDLPPSSYYNVKGRAEPDVAAVGSVGLLVVDGTIGVEGGTSMSSPIFAGVASLINEIAITKTGKPLGFLNPLLYKMAADAADTFHDVTEGDNICPEEYCGPNCKGFKATKGWDPVTGLGTPNAARMEAYVNQLLDDVMAKRARNTAATTTPTPASRFYSTQRKAPVRPITHVPVPRFPSVASKRVVSEFGVQPDEVWQGIAPLAVVSLNNNTLVMVLETSILTVAVGSWAITGNCSIDPSLQLGSVSSSSSGSVIYVTLLDELYGNVYLNGLDVTTCQTVSSASLKYPTNVLSIDGNGKTALTSAGGSAAVLMDTATGARRGYISNSSWDQVLAGAINPANSDVFVAWLQLTTTRFVSGIDVFSAGSNTTRFTITPPGLSLVEDVIIDTAGQFAYMFYALQTRDGFQLVVEQLSTKDGRSAGRWLLPNELQPTTALAAGGGTGEVYYMSFDKIVLLATDGIKSFQLGQYPYLPQPSDIVVTSDGDVLVAETATFQIVKLNQTGAQVGQYPTELPVASCHAIPLLDLGIDRHDNVYMPLCNSTIVIFSAAGGALAWVYTGNGTLPRGVAAGPHDSLFFTDDNHNQQVVQLSRDGKVLRTLTASGTVGWLFTVKYDHHNDGVYATDVTGGQIFYWALNSTAEPTRLDVSKAIGQPAEVYSMAIDYVHQQLLVTVICASESSLLWFDMQGTLLDKSFTYPMGIATGVAVSADGSRVYATDINSGAVYVFYQDATHVTLERLVSTVNARIVSE